MSEGFASAPPDDDELPEYSEGPTNNTNNQHDIPLPNYNNSDIKLDDFFFEFPYLSKSLKNSLTAKGVTLDKLLLMDDEQILLFRIFDPSIASDLILLIGALKKYKNKNNINNIDIDNDDNDPLAQLKAKNNYNNNDNHIPLSTDAGIPLSTDDGISNDFAQVRSFSYSDRRYTGNSVSIELKTKEKQKLKKRLAKIENNSDILMFANDYNYNNMDNNDMNKDNKKNIGLVELVKTMLENEDYEFILLYFMLLGITIFIIVYGTISNRTDCDYKYSGCPQKPNNPWKKYMIIMPFVTVFGKHCNNDIYLYNINDNKWNMIDTMVKDNNNIILLFMVVV